MSKDIEPMLSQIQRELVLVVEYKPVKSEQKAEAIQPHEPTKHVDNPTKGMKVTFPDGTVIWHRAAIDTFIDTLRKIGFDRIPKVGIEHGGGFNLVGKHKREAIPGRVWQHEADGWYIYSNISNGTKVEDLRRISDFYDLGLKIEEVKPEK